MTKWILIGVAITVAITLPVLSSITYSTSAQQASNSQNSSNIVTIKHSSNSTIPSYCNRTGHLNFTWCNPS